MVKVWLLQPFLLLYFLFLLSFYFERLSKKTLHVKQLLAFLLVFACVQQTFTAVLEAMFKVFGHNGGSTISVPLFFKLLFFIAKRDRDISPDVINALTKDL